MRKAVYAAAIVFLLIFIARNHLIGYAFDRCMRNIKPYIASKHETVLIADTRGDGSEVLTRELPEDVQESLDRLFLVAKFYYGPDSRLYVYMDNRSENNSLERLGIKSKYPEKVFYAKMEGYKMWRKSFIFNGNKKLYYVNIADAPIGALPGNGKFSWLTSFVFMSE
jgi:hypothetical protein